MLGSTNIWLLPPKSDYNDLNEIIDSSLLIDTKKGLILFSNDNLPCVEHADFINKLNGNKYLALIPFSGGSGYPCSYKNLSLDRKFEVAKQIRDNYENIAIQFLKSTNFEYFMPVAGNHTVVSRTYEWHKTTGFLQNPYSAIRKLIYQM